MTHISETDAAPSSAAPQAAWRDLLARLRRFAPFALGVAATLLGLYLYDILNPPAQTLTQKQVDAAVAQAMASATPPPAFSAQVYGAIQPSLVWITTGTGAKGRGGNGAGENGADEGMDTPDTEAHGLGSGVLISDRGEILTALHVVDGADNIQVVFADGTESAASIASSQPEHDIAVLQPEKLPGLLVPAVMGNPAALRIGDEAYAVGNPFGLYSSLSAGVVSGLNRSFRAEGSNQRIDGLIQVDTAVNPGNSGGPLLNRYGQVVGIVVGILNPTDQKFYVGIGFAVPITTAAGGAGAPPY